MLLLLVSFLFATALGLSPPAANPAMDAHFPSLSISNSSNLLTVGPTLKCEGNQYGYDLDRINCLLAWADIPTDNEAITYVQRESSLPYDAAVLPLRYLSPDGDCYIDVIHAAGFSQDETTHYEISTAAKRILDACVLRDETKRFSRPIGGRLSGIGRTGGLSLILGAYSSKVECIEDLPIHDYGECSKVLGRMQVTNFPHLFSSWEIPRKKSVIVPLGGIKFTGGLTKCTLTVDLLPGEYQDNGVWRKLWAAAVAVNYMCVRNGKSGISRGQGAAGRMSVSLGP